MAFQLNQTIFAQTFVNMRRTPGHVNKLIDDVITTLAYGAAAVVAGMAQTTDGLTWWPVRVNLPDGQTLTGWVAQAVGDTPLVDARNPTWVCQASPACPRKLPQAPYAASLLASAHRNGSVAARLHGQRSASV